MVIAALSPGDDLHEAALAALGGFEARRVIASVVVLAEVLVGAHRRGGGAVDQVEGFVGNSLDAVEDVTPSIARRAAEIRATHRALSLPDAITLATADDVGAADVLTADSRWRSVSDTVTVVA